VAKKLLLGRSIQDAFKLGEGKLQLKKTKAMDRKTKIGDLISPDAENALLWVIAEGPIIFGIITPFELM